MESIVKTLVKKRKALGITQQKMAKQLGISQATLSEFESERTTPRLDTLDRFARALGLELNFELTKHENRKIGIPK